MSYRPSSSAPSRWRVVLAMGVACLVILGLVKWLFFSPSHPSLGKALPPVEQTATLARPSWTEGLTYSSGTVPLKGSLSSILSKAGSPATEAYLVAQGLKPMFDVRRIRPGDAYELWTSSRGIVRGMRYWPTHFEFVEIERSSSTKGGWRLEKKSPKLTQTRMGASGELQSSLWDAMTAQGLSPDLIVRFADIFAWRIDFLTEPRPGDHFELVWLDRRTSDAAMQGDILFARYKGKETGEVVAVPYKNDFYDTEGKSLKGEFLRAPLSYRRISSGFTTRRYHPVLRYYRPHHGIDYAAATGTPVVAIGHGSVISAGWDGGLGKAVRIRHINGFVSIYGHLSRVGRGMRSGVSVAQGQVVGYVGMTGLATGPHLHFGFQQNGRMINFLGIRQGNVVRTIRSADKDAFQSARRDTLAALDRLPHSTSPTPL